MELLQSAVQQYAWGKKGKESVVAKLKGLGDSKYTVKPEETYAEMWIGTHPSGPSRVMRDGCPGPLLKEVLDDNPHVLGAIRWKGDLPFLFKVISISKALSIQAHPDKRLAERLHAERPDVYKDDNHKPEMAVTLSDFEGLCGFRPFYEIVWNLHAYPELRSMVSYSALKAVCVAGDDVERQRVALKKLFGSFVKCDKNVVRTQVAALVSRLEKKAKLKSDSPKPAARSMDPKTAPEPLRQVILAPSSSSINEASLPRNPSMHLGGFVNGGSGMMNTLGTMTSMDSSGSISECGAFSKGLRRDVLSSSTLSTVASTDSSVGSESDYAVRGNGNGDGVRSREVTVDELSESEYGTRGNGGGARPKDVVLDSMKKFETIEEAVPDGGTYAEDNCNEATGASDADILMSEEIFGKAFRGGPQAAAGLVARLEREDEDVQRVMLRLSTEYPGDLGMLMPLMLNLLQLKPGQSFFMTVDEPHAYLRGDILEVMACSNNVVRAALTPKFRDVNLLVEMLTYNMGAPAVLPAESVDAYRKRYTPPINDFEIQILQVPATDEYALEAMPVPVVLVVLKGGAGGRVIESESRKEIEVCEGGVFFLPAYTPVMVCSCSKGDGIEMALAHTNLHWGTLAAPSTASRAPAFT